VKLAEKYPNDPLALEVLTQAVRAMNSLDSAIQMSRQTNKTAFPIRSKEDSAELAAGSRGCCPGRCPGPGCAPGSSR
jgi:hypothetical protein